MPDGLVPGVSGGLKVYQSRRFENADLFSLCFFLKRTAKIN
jgi:hypothetical protein